MNSVEPRLLSYRESGYFAQIPQMSSSSSGSGSKYKDEDAEMLLSNSATHFRFDCLDRCMQEIVARFSDWPPALVMLAIQWQAKLS